MSLEFLLTKGVNAVFVFGFFAAIIWFLRFLYGPGGRLRDPQWDEWNERAAAGRRAELEPVESGPVEPAPAGAGRNGARPEDFALSGGGESESEQRRAFLDYGRSFFSGDPEHDAPLSLKVEHSLRVLANAEEIAAAEEIFTRGDLARALRLAALFHDVGRFEQIRRYRTFVDDLSCNHGALGARVIRAQGFLRGETKGMRTLVMAAVGAHNRTAVPANLNADLAAVLHALRDSDKLDILREMAREHLAPGKPRNEIVLLHLSDEPERFSPAIMAALDEGRCALYRDMRFVNDFRLLLCTWLNELRHAASFAIAKRDGSFPLLLDGLALVPEARDKAAAFVKSRLGA